MAVGGQHAFRYPADSMICSSRSRALTSPLEVKDNPVIPSPLQSTFALLQKDFRLDVVQAPRDRGTRANSLYFRTPSFIVTLMGPATTAPSGEDAKPPSNATNVDVCPTEAYDGESSYILALPRSVGPVTTAPWHLASPCEAPRHALYR
jgi:hypothetical protein